VKNKLAPPFREAEFDIMYGEGVSLIGDLLDVGVEHNIVEKSGSWYSYSSERIGQGRENAKQFLRDHPETLEKIDTQVRLTLGLAKPVAVEAPAVPEPTRAAGARGAKA